MREPNRTPPALPVQAYKTYSVLAPAVTHFKAASCEEVRCPQQARGWRTLIDETTALGQRQAHYIRATSRRKFVEERTPEGLTAFVFEAGQTCFTQHRARLDREATYLVRGGDWRGNPGGESRRHVRAADWVEDFALHQQGVSERIERG